MEIISVVLTIVLFFLIVWGFLLTRSNDCVKSLRYRIRLDVVKVILSLIRVILVMVLEQPAYLIVGFIGLAIICWIDAILLAYILDVVKEEKSTDDQ